ncbi:hypothetical protein LIER_10676 [Lithospermum erythrorhizon]|uniref:WAT1-related protein n=1 Tax=Lithospermum erythrorhizon TaxID=34254 RepID=A0AAV3PLP4_LITER
MAMETYLFYKELLPFAAMIIVQCTLVGSNILFKSASSRGVSNYVFTVYTYAIATVVTSPFAFIFYRRMRLPRISTSILYKIFYLAMLGVSTIICVYIGLEYSSPTLASAVGNLTSAFTFILAILFRFFFLNEL